MKRIEFVVLVQQLQDVRESHDETVISETGSNFVLLVDFLFATHGILDEI